MAERVWEEGGMIENQNGELISEALNQSERATDALVQPSESIFTYLYFDSQNQMSKRPNSLFRADSTLRNNSNQPNYRSSSSLTPLSSRASSPRRRPTPRSASPSQQYSTRMSNSPRSNSIHEESPDTTLENAGTGGLGADIAERKARSRDGSQEMELDYGESEEENEVGNEKAEPFDRNTNSDVDRGEYKSGKETKNSGEFLEGLNPSTS